MKEKKQVFIKTKKEKRDLLKKILFSIEKDTFRIHLKDLLGYVFDIEEELVNSSIYQMVTKEETL